MGKHARQEPVHPDFTGTQADSQTIAAVTGILAEQGLNIDAIKRLTGRIPLDERKANVRACIEFSVRGTPAKGKRCNRR